MLVAPPQDIHPFSGRFVGTTHIFALRVYFEDTDFSGIVYHANYLRYFERARSDMLRAIGIDQRASFDQGKGVYAVSEMHINYQSPAKLEDDLYVMSEVTKIRAAACHIHQRVIRRSQEEPTGQGFIPIAETTMVAALLAPSGRPTRQPEQWVKAFKSVMPKQKESE